MIHLRPYTAADRELWDAFVRESRDGTFLFERAYMDYHADRFHDHSLLFFDNKERLLAVLPANECDHQLYSHQGLTYGGLVLAPRAVSADVSAMLGLLVDHARSAGFSAVHYKPVPSVYHRQPAGEDVYFLWRMGARTEFRNLSSAVDLHSDFAGIRAEYCRRNVHARLLRGGYTVDREAPLAEYWPMLTDTLLSRHGASPVHTLGEMERLQLAFPGRILCCLVRNAAGEAEGGVVLFRTDRVMHVQYSASTPAGRHTSALDFLYMTLLEDCRADSRLRYFDFGTSNEDGGRILNESLIHFKESFGGRGVVYEGYCIDV